MLNNPFKRYWPAIIWSAIIFLLLAIPGSDLPQESSFLDIPHFDKWIHMGIFALFVILWCRALRIWHPAKKLFLNFILVALAGIAFGYAMELVQKYFIPNRDYDLWDVVADAAGSLLGLAFSLIAFRKK